MPLSDDEREQIVEIVDARLDHRQLASPLPVIQATVERIRKELFNGDDGKTGFIPESRKFFGDWNTRNDVTDRRKKRTAWATTTAIAILGIFGAGPVAAGWEDIQALMSLARKAPDIIKLTDDWKNYYSRPDPAPFTLVPQDTQPKKKPSFFSPRGRKSEFNTPPSLLSDGGDHSQ
jgi:hypothetical protein